MIENPKFLTDLLTNQNRSVVRIAAIEMWHFKSVSHGKACFPAVDPEAPAGADPNILAVYGQNGSGKTALIQAIALLKLLLSGQAVPDTFADCVERSAGQAVPGAVAGRTDKSDSCATLTYTFTIQSPHGFQAFGDVESAGEDVLTVYYTVKLASDEKAKEDEAKVIVFDEKLLAEGHIGGKPFPRQTLLDATGPELRPERAVREYFARLAPNDLADVLHVPRPLDRSFLFFEVLFHFGFGFRLKGLGRICFCVLSELFSFASICMYVIGTESDGAVRQNQVLPFYMIDFGDRTKIDIPMNGTFKEDPRTRREIESYLESMSLVMDAIVPGLRLQLREEAPDVDPGPLAAVRKPEPDLYLVSVREGRELPLRCESDGVRHILSMLWLLIWTYNSPYLLLAVDELDAGVFEFLLGELLQVFKDSGRGQLLFTAHNLRPLEVLDNDSILFTTTDPEDRYRKLTGLGEGENLRRAYYREILLHEHFDDLYAPTKRYRIAMAMANAAADYAERAKEKMADDFGGEEW